MSQISRFFLTFIEGYAIPSHVWEYPKYRVIPDIPGYPLPDDIKTESGRVGCRKNTGSGSGSVTCWALKGSARVMTEPETSKNLHQLGQLKYTPRFASLVEAKYFDLLGAP